VFSHFFVYLNCQSFQPPAHLMSMEDIRATVEHSAAENPAFQWGEYLFVPDYAPPPGRQVDICDLRPA
jgi:hypothetical protein